MIQFPKFSGFVVPRQVVNNDNVSQIQAIADAINSDPRFEEIPFAVVCSEVIAPYNQHGGSRNLGSAFVVLQCKADASRNGDVKAGTRFESISRPQVGNRNYGAPARLMPLPEWLDKIYNLAMQLDKLYGFSESWKKQQETEQRNADWS